MLSHESRFPIRLAAVLLASGLVVACGLARHRNDAPPQGWWSERGPVVPHDSFPADCSTCHAGEAWNRLVPDFKFDHEAQAGVALTGAHVRAECLRCHNDRGPVALFANRGCAGCHEDPHRGQLGRDCVTCHDDRDWRPRQSIASHDRTRFPLVGAHAATPCWSCHPGAEVGNFTRVGVACEGCHAGDIARAVAPDHRALGLVADCQRCHESVSWQGARFDHRGFPLTGGHARTGCEGCHGGGGFTALPTDCASCHQQDYDRAREPDHRAGNFPTRCEVCHSTNAFRPATAFSHSGITSGCVACHDADYRGTRDPNHVAAGFPTACESCHRPSGWRPATAFSHAGITSGCVACHDADYRGTRDPNHAAAGFPKTCESCHRTSAWQPATFRHRFPITSGDHRGLACNDCHTNPATVASFTCVDCHAHRRGDMDDEHRGVSGYRYQSSACVSCHPDGRE